MKAKLTYVPPHHVETSSTTARVPGGGGQTGQMVPVGSPNSNSVLRSSSGGGGGGGGGNAVPEPEVTPDKVTLVTPRDGPNAGQTSIYQGLPGQHGGLVAQGSGIPPQAIIQGVTRTPAGYQVNYVQPAPQAPTGGVSPSGFNGYVYKGENTPLLSGGNQYGQTYSIQGPQPSPQSSGNSSIYLGSNWGASVPVGNDPSLNFYVSRQVSPQETINVLPTVNDIYGVPNYTEYPRNVTAPQEVIKNNATRSSIYNPETGLLNFSALQETAANVNLDQAALKGFKQGDVVGTAGGLALAGISFFTSAGEAVAHTPEFFSPVNYRGEFQYPIVQPFAESVNAVVTNPQETVIQRPFSFAGSIYGGVLGGKILDATIVKTKDAYVATGSKYTPPQEVFNEQVLAGEQRFPYSQGTPDALQQFQEGGGVVVHSGPSKVAGDTAGAGGAAKAGLEDPGIYGTPKGQGSPHFLKIDETGYKKVTLNPLTWIEGLFKQPTVTEFKTKGVTTQPPEVLAKPGFGATAEFFAEEGSKTGQGYITKRSMIGQGEVSGAGIPDPIARRGTSEVEAVIPEGAKFQYEEPTTFLGKIKGYEEYTEYAGRNIPIRKAKLAGSSDAEASQNLVNFDDLRQSGSYSYSRTEEATPVLLGTSDISTEAPSTPSSASSQSLIESELFPSLAPESSSSSGNSTEGFSVLSSTSDTNGSSGGSSGSEVSSGLLDTPSSPGGESGDSSIISSPEPESTLSLISNPGTSAPPSPVSLIYPGKPEPPVPPKINTFSVGGNKRKGKFTTKVRRKGQFQTEGTFDSAQKAFAKGFEGIKNTAAASFKVEEEGKGVVKLPIPAQLTDQLYKSRKEKGVFIQPRSKRIGTGGEKREIPGKAAVINKLRSGFKGGFKL